MTHDALAAGVEERFWALVDIRGPDECWPWRGQRNRDGYGRIRREGRQRPATRMAWELANGQPFPKGKIACHTCDNPPCVNPGHLWPGTHKQNYEDAVSKGRSAGFGVTNAQKEFCGGGHPLSGDNLILKETAKCVARICRTCQRNYHLEWRMKNRPVMTKPRLTDAQRDEIRASSEPTRVLVARYGVDRSAITRYRAAALAHREGRS